MNEHLRTLVIIDNGDTLQIEGSVPDTDKDFYETLISFCISVADLDIKHVMRAYFNSF